MWVCGAQKKSACPKTGGKTFAAQKSLRPSKRTNRQGMSGLKTDLLKFQPGPQFALGRGGNCQDCTPERGFCDVSFAVFFPRGFQLAQVSVNLRREPGAPSSVYSLANFHPKNPRYGLLPKLGRLGKTPAIWLSERPSQRPMVPAYCSTAISGMRRPKPTSFSASLPMTGHWP